MKKQIVNRENFRKYYTRILEKNIFQNEHCGNDFACFVVNYCLGEEDAWGEAKIIFDMIAKAKIDHMKFENILNNMLRDALHIIEIEVACYYKKEEK
jgi:hypothetical protein